MSGFLFKSVDLNNILSRDINYKDSTFTMNTYNSFITTAQTPLKFQQKTDIFSTSPNVNYISSTDIGPQCRSNYTILTPTITVNNRYIYFDGNNPQDSTYTVNVPPNCTNANIMIIASGGGGGRSGGNGAGNGVNGSGGGFLSFNYKCNVNETLTVTIGQPGMGTSQGTNDAYSNGSNYFQFSNNANNATPTTIVSNINGSLVSVPGGKGGAVGTTSLPVNTPGSGQATIYFPSNISVYNNVSSDPVISPFLFAGSGNTNVNSTSDYPLNLLQNPIVKLNNNGNDIIQYPYVPHNSMYYYSPLFLGSNYIPYPYYTNGSTIRNGDVAVTDPTGVSISISYGSGGFAGNRYNLNSGQMGYYGWNGDLSGPGAAGAPGIVIIFWRYN